MLHSDEKFFVSVVLYTHVYMPVMVEFFCTNIAYNNAFRSSGHQEPYLWVHGEIGIFFSAVTNDARYRSRIVRHWLKILYVHFDGGWVCICSYSRPIQPFCQFCS